MCIASSARAWNVNVQDIMAITLQTFGGGSKLIHACLRVCLATWCWSGKSVRAKAKAGIVDEDYEGAGGKVRTGECRRMQANKTGYFVYLIFDT